MTPTRYGVVFSIHEYLDAFTYAYAECLLWANTREYESDEDEGREVDPAWWHLPAADWALQAFDEAAQRSIREDTRAFVASNWRDLRDLDPSRAGHDFLLTRSGHGAGFWDRGLGEVGERLTAASKPYGDTNGYLFPGSTLVVLD